MGERGSTATPLRCQNPSSGVAGLGLSHAPNLLRSCIGPAVPTPGAGLCPPALGIANHPTSQKVLNSTAVAILRLSIL